MNVRRVLPIGAVVAAWALALAPMLPTFGASSGTTLDAQGWWNSAQALPVQGDPTGLGLTTVPTVPASATIPADGLSVAEDTSGASAIAAVRYRLGGAAGGTLTLTLASGTKLTGTEQVVACPIEGGFTPVQNGRWDAKPAYEPTACIVEGKPNADGTALTFDVPATFSSALGDVSILVAPLPTSTTPFSLAFDKPTDDAFAVTTQVDSTPPPPSAPAYEPGSAVYTAPAASSAFAAPTAPSVAAPAAPSTGGGGQAATVPATIVPTSEVTSRSAHVVAVLALVLIGAALFWLASQPQRVPRLLGSVGGAHQTDDVQVRAVARTGRARGVGRFARHRDVPATPI